MLYILPFISALIGWVTNFIAVKMLFHPKTEVNLGLFKLHGIFPKRQKQLAEKLGAIVSKELFSFSDIKGELLKPENIAEVNTVLESKIDVFLNEKLAKSMPMIAMFINDGVKQKIKDTLMAEFGNSLPEVLENYSEKLEKSIDVEKIVYDKVIAFSTDKLEDILFSIMKKEFKFIELLGGVLGFIIGLIQVILIKYVG